MLNLRADLVIVGGGATGAGVARDAAMRGYEVVLLERADIGQGTSARYHGLLHSGGRYVISDPESATQCADESAIVRRINADAVEDTGGLFVLPPGDPDEYADRFLPAALEAGVPCEEISISQALKEEPRLNPGIKRAFRVRDGAVDGWRLIWGALESAKEYGAKIMPYHRVTAIHVENDKVNGVTARNEKTGEEVKIDCRFVINASGPWAGEIATMAGAEKVQVVPGRGIMIGFNQRLVHHVVNRCAISGDGDILVPAHPICIIGTTDQAAVKPDFLAIKPEEVQKMLDKAEDLVPGIRQARALHVWSGARPLVKDSRVAATDTRHMARGMAILDHLTRDGIGGFLTIAGGKFTTYRLMGEKVVNAMCHQLGDNRICHTAEEPVPSAATRRFSHLSDRLKDREEDRHDEPIICECELVNRRMITEKLKENPVANIDDLRRQLRIGMGPCQGTFCGARTAGIIHEFRQANPTATGAAGTETAAAPAKSKSAKADAPASTADVSTTMLKLFFSNRLGGIRPIMYGAMAREMALQKWVVSTLNLEHLPDPSPASSLATGDLALNHGIDRDDPKGGAK
ncbi:anaerobic glycerol-3-phosphate dehydrogenase subunit GlpA [Mobiluncus sp.]|uniref:anaerobic glycerol-3-phosphate dehydrogenase subunit GlpA n=1 Tax=Mobiluncus sp. TaxID=47293 RepID=UPI002A91F56A|nr:anaerobic glycerol-3-phosphate dehydrogenase subunit GlpA [Mobiluncus sp.]MDY6077111.1 anaerobic glycerol-3-phosphate dehydrogenase subunit GlpA [Mobiluncus sp.]